MERILVFDSKDRASESLVSLLSEKGFLVDRVCRRKRVLEDIEKNEYLLAFLDLRRKKGLEFIKEVKKRKKDLPLIIMTAPQGTKDAIEAMRFGAFHYLVKPLNLEEAEILIQRAKELHSLHSELSFLRKEIEKRGDLWNSFPQSPEAGKFSLEELVRSKIEEFLRKVDGFPLKGLYSLVIPKMEKLLITLVLEKTKGNQVKCAKILGITRNTLRRKIASLKIPLDKR